MDISILYVCSLRDFLATCHRHTALNLHSIPMNDPDDDEVIVALSTAMVSIISSANKMIEGAELATKDDVSVQKRRAAEIRRDARSIVKKARRNGVRLRCNPENIQDLEELFIQGPGRGFTANGAQKRQYRRGTGRSFAGMQFPLSFYSLIRGSADPSIFQQTVHVSTDQFDALHECVSAHLNLPLLSDSSASDMAEELLGSRAASHRILSTEQLLFFFLHSLSGGSEGSIGVRLLGDLHGISKGTVSNYFCHTVLAIHMALRETHCARIEWPTVQERAEMKDQLRGFPNAVGFVDGVRGRVPRSTDPKRQRYQFCGHKKVHCNVALVWVDLSGLFIRIDFSSKGSSNDRGIFNGTDPFLYSERFFSNDQHVVCDSGFIGAGSVVCPYRRGSGYDDPNRTGINADVRLQRWINEHCISFVSNRFRSFMGHWQWAEELWEVAFETIAMITNFTWRRTNTRIILPACRLLQREDERILRTS